MIFSPDALKEMAHIHALREKGDNAIAGYRDFNGEEGYWIELNGNYPIESANAFLMRKWINGNTFERQVECIGGVDRDGDGLAWVAIANAPYDPGTDSDARLVGKFPTRELALEALWSERNAIVY